MNQVFEFALSAKKILNFVETEYTEFVSTSLNKYNNINLTLMDSYRFRNEMLVCNSRKWFIVRKHVPRWS